MIAEIFLALLLGWLLADLASGFFHWLEDRVLWVGMPLISGSIVEPNRLHHKAPCAFLDNSFFDRNSTTWAVAVQLSFFWFLLFGFSYVWLSATLGGMVVTEVHALAHRKQTGLVAALQEIGIIQSPVHHSGHHRAGYDRRYCMLTGWCNPILEWIGLWAALERFLTTIGLEPNRGTK